MSDESDNANEVDPNGAAKRVDDDAPIVIPETDESYDVGPATGETPRSMAPVDPPLEFPEEPVSQQVPLWFLFVLMTLAAAMLVPLRMLSPGDAAAAIGFLALIGMLLMFIFRPRQAWVHYLWWFVVAAYLVGCLVALMMPAGKD